MNDIRIFDPLPTLLKVWFSIIYDKIYFLTMIAHTSGHQCGFRRSCQIFDHETPLKQLPNVQYKRL